MESGSFDVKGLAEFAVKAGAKKVGLDFLGEHIIPIVGAGLGALGIPAKVELDWCQTLLAKLVVEGVKRQEVYDNELRNRQQQQSANTTI